jgi:hypothetical protein
LDVTSWQRLAERKKDACGRPLFFVKHFGAEDEVRTRDLQLGKLSLYQLSYFRDYSQSTGNLH